MSQFGETLRKLRGNRSLREMERITGLSHTYLSTLEKGIDPRSGKERKPTPEVIAKIADSLNANYLYLMQVAGYMGNQSLEELLLTKIELEKELEDISHNTKSLTEKLKINHEVRNENGISTSEKSSEGFKAYRQKREELNKEWKDITESISGNMEQSLRITNKINDIDSLINLINTKDNEEDNLDLELLLSSNKPVYFQNKPLTSEEKDKVLQILKITLN